MMINKNEECDIMNDLLPLYVEQLTQKDTSKWIETHLAECETCRQTYEIMKDSFTEVLKEEKKVKKKKVKLFQKVRLRLFLYGYVLLLIAIWLYCILDFMDFF